jgi:hypothetical protein
MTSIVFQVDTDVSEEHTASIFRVESYSFNNCDGYANNTTEDRRGGGRGLCKWEKWAACNTIPPKRQYPPTTLIAVGVSQTAIQTSSVTCSSL